MKINGTKIKKGEQKVINLSVSRLPSGTDIYINAHVYRSEQPGETALILGGVHGDEINGIEIVRRLIANGCFDLLQKGSVIAIPLLNVYGFINFSREVPDGKDVNRSFPGSKNGSLASRVAYAVSTEILPNVDFGLDFHTGGRSHYNYPQIRYTPDHEAAQVLAQVFAAPIAFESRTIAKSLRRKAKDMGIPMLVFEGGENLRFDGFSIAQGLAGVRRVLHAKGMLPDAPEPEKMQTFTSSRWLRAPRAGIFRWTKCSGHRIRKNEPLGYINDPYGEEETIVRAPNDGFIIGHNNSPVISQGDALYHIAQ